MNTYRSNAVFAGILLILATAGSLIGNAVVKALTADPVDLSRIANDATPIFAGVLIKLVAYAACPGIALALYPVLRRYDPGLALGSVIFRLAEAVFYAAGAVALLLLVSLGRDSVTAGAADAAYFGHSASLLLAASNWLGFGAAVPFFGLGALLYYVVMFRFGLVPRWLSGWGVAGAVLAIAASTLVLLDVAAPMSSLHIALNLPIFAQEMVLAVWLITKGFMVQGVVETRVEGRLMASAKALS